MKKPQSQNNIDEIELTRRPQSNNANCFKYKKDWYTVSLLNKCGKKLPKTSKGLTALANNSVKGN